MTHADSVQPRFAATRTRRRPTRSAASCRTRRYSAWRREHRGPDSRRRQGIRAVHDERLAGRRLAASADRHLERELLAVPAARAARRARVDRGRHQEHASRSDAAPRSTTPSRRFAAATSRTKSCCSARISIRGTSATGGTDNGTGCDRRARGGADPQGRRRASPKRTIRFVLFSGEEEGCSARRRTPKRTARSSQVQAVLVLDNGTRAHHRHGAAGPRRAARPVDVDVRAAADSARSPCARATRRAPTISRSSIWRAGVQLRSADARVQPHAPLAGRRLRPHVPGDIAQAATVMAVNAWQLANWTVAAGK